MKKKNRPTSVFDQMRMSPTALQQLGAAIGMSMAQTQQSLANQQLPQFILKEASLGSPNGVNIYGRNSIFDPCVSGDVFGMQVETNGLISWLGWRSNRFYSRRVQFIDWWGPEGTVAGNSTTGSGSPCDDPDSWEYGKCGYNLTHTSWYHRSGKTLGPHEVVQDRCETTPRYRLNGKLITDDVEWQMNGAMNALWMSIRRDLIHGNHDNGYEMNGLEQLIKTGYIDPDTEHACPSIDASIINWAHDDLDGAVNGLGNFFDYLDELVTEKEWRASAIGRIAEIDMALITSRFMATCLLDAYACYTTCGVTSTSDITDQALRAQQRAARRELNGGPLYDGTTAVGYIHLKSGRRVPIIVEDTMDVSYNGTNYCTDIYLLVRRVGSVDTLYGEYLDLRAFENRVKKVDPNFSVRADAAGRFAFKAKEDNWCWQVMVGTSPEIYLAAPWACARIQDVCCSRKRQPVVGDPFQPTYLPGGRPLYTAIPDQ